MICWWHKLTLLPQESRLIRKKNIYNELVEINSSSVINDLWKTNCIFFYSHKNADIKLIPPNTSGQTIQRVSSTKFLGFLIDEYLGFKHHIEDLTKKLTKFSALFFKIRQYLPLSALFTLFKTLHKPCLNYCNVIWCNTLSTNPVNVKSTVHVCVIYVDVCD